MKGKRRITYFVSIPGHWYSHKLKKWVPDDKIQWSEGKFSNSQIFRTCKVFKKDWPVGTSIEKRSLCKGKYLWTDYEVVN